MVQGGDVTYSDGKYIPHITAPDGSVVAIGKFGSHEEAGAAYLAKLAELYPPGPSPEIDPTRHHTLAAVDIVTKPFNLT